MCVSFSIGHDPNKTNALDLPRNPEKEKKNVAIIFEHFIRFGGRTSFSTIHQTKYAEYTIVAVTAKKPQTSVARAPVVKATGGSRGRSEKKRKNSAGGCSYICNGRPIRNMQCVRVAASPVHAVYANGVSAQLFPSRHRVRPHLLAARAHDYPLAGRPRRRL